MPDLVNTPEFEKQCYDISHEWFIVDGVDFSSIEEVSLGGVVQLQVFEKLFENAQVNADRNDIRSIIKRFSLEWTARASASLFDSTDDDQSADIMFIYDVNNDPMIHALNTLGVSLEEKGHSVLAVIIDKTIANKCSVKRKISWFKRLSFSGFLNAVRSLFKLHHDRRSKFEKYFSSLVASCGVNKARVVNRYFNWQSFQVLLEVSAVQSLLRDKRPAVVVLASDAHRVSRMVVFLCKAMNIKTVVYQHGATIWEYGYIPVYADRMLVWGEASKQWFVNRSVKEEKLVEVGNLRSDELGYKDLDVRQFAEKRKLYFFPNPIDRKITEQVIELFIDLCERFDMEGVLKLHPSEKNLHFFEERISKVKSLISISTDPVNEAGITPGDVAVVVNSTAGVDFCLEGGYVLNIEVQSMPNPIDYEGYGVGVKATLDTYLEDFERLSLIDPADYLKKRKMFIYSYLGNLDGQAKQRACAVIECFAKSKSR